MDTCILPERFHYEDGIHFFDCIQCYKIVSDSSKAFYWNLFLSPPFTNEGYNSHLETPAVKCFYHLENISFCIRSTNPILQGIPIAKHVRSSRNNPIMRMFPNGHISNFAGFYLRRWNPVGSLTVTPLANRERKNPSKIYCLFT